VENTFVTNSELRIIEYTKGHQILLRFNTLQAVQNIRTFHSLKYTSKGKFKIPWLGTKEHMFQQTFEKLRILSEKTTTPAPKSKKVLDT